jgi:uncharacterized iron-regulated membrane protein
MKAGFRQTMAFLHGWAGLIPGWLLYAVFLTGTISYYRQEVTQWMRPELAGVTADPQALDHGLRYLRDNAPDAALWRIDLPTDRNPVMEVMWREPQGGFSQHELDPRDGKPLHARETMGGDFLYYFHFDLNFPGRIGRWLVCFAAIAMLVAIVSGVITHRRIFADFFTFRPGKGQRSWLDAHNVMGVAALPYHLLITFSGLVTLSLLYMPWGVDRAYHGDRAAFSAELAGDVHDLVRSGKPAAMASIPGMAAHAQALWGGVPAGRVLIANPGDAAATVTIEQRDSAHISYDRPSIRFAASTGKVIDRHDGGGAGVATYSTLYGLHLARFADWRLRCLFFVSGLLGTAMVATGLILWVVKRAPQSGGDGGSSHRLAARLNVGFIVGLPLAIGGFFLANRLLPAMLPGRGRIEIAGFFLCWGLALLHALRQPPERAWRLQLCVGAVVYLALPFLSAWCTQAGLGHSLATGDWQRAGIDIALFAAGLCSLSLAGAMRRRAG